MSSVISILPTTARLMDHELALALIGVSAAAALVFLGVWFLAFRGTE